MKISSLTLLCVASLMLVSCGGSSDTNKPVTPTSSAPKVAAPAPTATGGSIPTQENGAYVQSIQAIIALQLKDPDTILKLNCDTYDEAGKKYCTDEKAKLSAVKNEITWESVLKKGPEFIKTFDCKKLASEFGQKYCSEYQAGTKPAK